MSEQDIFIAAMDHEDPADRKQYLDQTCKGDPALRERVENLICQSDQLGSFLEHPPVEVATAAAQSGNSQDEVDPTIVYDQGSTHDDEGEATVPGRLMSQSPRDEEHETLLGFLECSNQPDSLGRLGHYEILEVVGRGAFGTVLRAFDEKLQRIVAVKVLAPEIAATSPARKRFLREARTSAQIRHENVVYIHAVEDEPLPNLVMEYIPGKTLGKRLKEQGPLDLPDVLRLGKQIADGLAAAHEKGLIHRDIKPGNILLEGGMDERVKITDFGLARTADDANMTQSGVIAGTPLFMAPEQVQGAKLDQRADLFSFGSVLYQMLSGRPPFRARTTIAVLKRVTEDTPRPIPEIIPEVPAWICELIGHLHAKDREKRYGTAREVSELLAKCARELEAGRVPKIPVPSKTEQHAEKPAALRSSHKVSLIQKPLLKVAAAVMLLLAMLGITEAAGVTRFASTVIRLTTGSGTLLIETDATGMQIAINEEEVTITGGGVEELTLRPGEYKIAALKNGKPVKQELVSITRNGKTVVRMSLEPDASTMKLEGTQLSQYLGVPLRKEIVVGKDNDGKEVNLTLLLIPPGEFLMGSNDEELATSLEEAKSDENQWAIDSIPNEGPQHRVRITKPFWLGRHEVTLGQFRTFVDQTGYQTDAESDGVGGFAFVEGNWVQKPEFVWNGKHGFSKTENHPAIFVSWNDASAFCQWLSKEQGGDTFSLPTEANWEYACRAGTTTFWSSGTREDLPQLGWSGENSGRTLHAVGELRPNGFGLHDMHGNVWEWCADWYAADYYANSTWIDPAGATEGAARVQRGGDFFYHSCHARSAYRHYGEPGRSRSFSLGFRVAAALPEDVFHSKLSVTATNSDP